MVLSPSACGRCVRSKLSRLGEAGTVANRRRLVTRPAGSCPVATGLSVATDLTHGKPGRSRLAAAPAAMPASVFHPMRRVAPRIPPHALAFAPILQRIRDGQRERVWRSRGRDLVLPRAVADRWTRIVCGHRPHIAGRNTRKRGGLSATPFVPDRSRASPTSVLDQLWVEWTRSPSRPCRRRPASPGRCPSSAARPPSPRW